jgi:hypothetical protein
VVARTYKLIPGKKALSNKINLISVAFLLGTKSFFLFIPAATGNHANPAIL